MTTSQNDELSSTFFGTLRSELDEPTELHGAFADIAERFHALRGAYLRGDLDKAGFGRALVELVHVDPQGASWTIGAGTGNWYTKQPGSEWRPAVPPSHDDVAAELSDSDLDAAVNAWDGSSLEVGDGAGQLPVLYTPAEPASTTPAAASEPAGAAAVFADEPAVVLSDSDDDFSDIEALVATLDETDTDAETDDGFAAGDAAAVTGSAFDADAEVGDDDASTDALLDSIDAVLDEDLTGDDAVVLGAGSGPLTVPQPDAEPGGAARLTGGYGDL